MAEWEGWLILLTFIFAIFGGLAHWGAVECDRALGRKKDALIMLKHEVLADEEAVRVKAGRCRRSRNRFFTLFFVSFILTFIAHASR